MNDPACWSWPDPGITEASSSAERHRAVREWQAGRCAVCGVDDPELVEDHDHYTGRSRGWLCRSCNGLEAKSPAVRFVRYRLCNPASIWMMTCEYMPVCGTTPAITDVDALDALESGALTLEQVRAGVRVPRDIWSNNAAKHLGL